jgi:hypothetical protein
MLRSRHTTPNIPIETSASSTLRFRVKIELLDLRGFENLGGLGECSSINHAKQIGYTPELVLEMALADFLDPESLTFTDCKPLIGLAAESESMPL